MAWNLDSNRPIYLQLVEELENRIVTGVYLPGSQLPGVRVLAQEAAVNPNTMQKALQELERSGLVYAQRTSGRFVTDDAEMLQHLRLRMARQHAAAYLAAVKKLGLSTDEALTLIKETERNDEHDPNSGM